VCCFTRYRNQKPNQRTRLERIARRAGLTPQRIPFQNERSMRETELAEAYPMHVGCKWLGNSELVAAKHYLQLTDDHFKRAVHKPTNNALQYAMQHSGAGDRNGSQEKSTSVAGPAICRALPSTARRSE